MSTEACGNSRLHFATGGEVPSLADQLAEAERRGAVKALRNLPDHLKPNMSLAAQIDARADAIENGAPL